MKKYLLSFIVMLAYTFSAFAEVSAEVAALNPGDDASFLGSTAQSAWTCDQGNGPGVYAGTYTETYNGSANVPGKVMYQTISGLKKGTYEIKFLATANMAWIGAQTGANIAQVYCNDQTYDIDVIGQTACTPTDYERTFMVTVPEDGSIEFGLQNIGTGGNWYVAHFVSLTYMGNVNPARAEEYAEVLNLWQTVNTTNYRYDAEFEDQVVTSDILNDMNKADKLLVKVFETYFDIDSDSQNQADLAEARSLIEAAQQAAVESYQVLKDNKNAYEAINEEIQNLRDELAAAETKIETEYPDANVADAVQAIKDKIDALQADADQAFADKTAVDFKENTLPGKAQEIRDDIANLLQDAAEQQRIADEKKAKDAADAIVASELPAGEYYFQDTNTGLFLAPGNNWGTHASLKANPVAFKLASISNAVYTIESCVSNGGENYYLNGAYCDGPASNIYVTKAADGAYYLSNVDATAYYIQGANGVESALVESNGSADAAIAWRIVPTSEINAGDNVSFVIKAADFGRNNRYLSAWVGESAGPGNFQINGGNQELTWYARSFEAWHKSFKQSQTIENLPAGYYTLAVQAAVSDTKDAPVVFANNRSAAFTQKGNEGSAENVAKAFAADPTLNLVKVEVKLAEGEALVIGAQGTRQDTWAVWDNFTLTYNGQDDTAYNEFVAASLQADLDAAKQKFEDAKTEIAQLDAFVATATEEDVNAIQGKIDAAQDKIDNAAAESEIIEAIAQINADIDALVEKANNLQTTNKAAYDELIAAYNELKDQWQATYDRINAKYAGMVDNEDYIIKIYQGETLTPEEIQATGAYEKNGAWYVNAFITRDDFNKILTGLNKVDYKRNLDGYDEETDAIERSYVKGACEANKEYILAEIQKDSEAIEAVWNKARTDHDANILNANNTNLKQLNKAYDANVDAYKKAINKVNDHIAIVHDAEIAKQANNDLFEIYKAQEAAMKAATDAYNAVEAKNDELKQNDTYPTEIFHYEEYATKLDEDVNAQCQDILAVATAAAVAENAVLYAEYETKANALLALITTAQATVDTYSEAVKATYTAQLDAKKAEINNFIENTLKPYDNTEDDPCITEDKPELDIAIADFEDKIAAIAQEAKDAEDAHKANEAAYAEVLAEINNVLDKLTADKAVVDSYDPTVRVATYDELKEALLNLAADAEASKLDGTAVADSAVQLAQLKELDADVDEYFNDALLDIINAKADAAAEYLAEVKAAIEAYTFPGKETYVEEADKIAKEIADLKDAAKADYDAIELIDTYETYIKQIGEKVGEAKGLRRAAATAEVEIALGANAYADLNGTDYTINDEKAYKAGTTSKVGVINVTVPANTTAITFNAIAWKGAGSPALVISTEEGAEVASVELVADDAISGNGPAYVIEEEYDYTVTLEAATTEATTFSFTSDKRFFLYNVAAVLASSEEPVDPTPVAPADDKTIYEEIEALKAAAAEAQAKYEAELANQAAYDETIAKIDELQDKLDAAEEILNGYDEDYTDEVAAIQEEINQLYKDAKDALENGTAVADSAAILTQIPAIETEIEDLLDEAAIAQSDYYKEQLADQVDALKETWNKAYAATSDAAELARLDAIYNDIQSIAAEIASDETILDAEDFAEDKAALDALDKAILKATDLEKYLAENVTKGDLTGGNNGLDINDVTTLIDIIISDTDLSGYDNAEMFYAADVNGDGVINILDITTLINLILEAPVEEGNSAKTRMVNNDYLVADGTELSLINTNAYTTFQMDITVADGATLNDIMLADRASDFQVAFGQISANTYRVVVVSLSNSTIAGNEGLLINLDITGDQTAEFSNVLFSDVRAQGYALPIISDATAIAAIKANVDADCQIFTMGGAQVNGLQKGINIVKYADGSTKKLFVK